MDSVAGFADFIYGRVASSDFPALTSLQAAGFLAVGGEVVGVIETGKVEPPEMPATVAVVPAREEHLDDILRIARASHDINHFAYDPRFPARRVAELYEGVVQSDAADADASLLVAEQAGAVVGFHSYRRNRRFERYVRQKTVGLNYIGVDPALRVRGLGEILTREVLFRLQRAGVRRATVRTMLSNYHALATLKKVDANIASANVVLHYWRPHGDGGR
jgi:ribosomal protein S18 acetylase RimI-like enzyme